MRQEGSQSLPEVEEVLLFRIRIVIQVILAENFDEHSTRIVLYPSSEVMI